MKNKLHTRMPQVLLRSLALSLTLSPLAQVEAASSTPDFQLKPKRIDQVFSDFTSQSPGCALGVFSRGKMLYARGYGLAELNHGVRIQPNTVFDIGSTSKQFTALALLMLARDGKLSLDDDVRRYLPELPDLGVTISLQQLLWHTAGLRDYNELMLLAGYKEEDVTEDADALRLLIAQRGLNFAPGSRYSYSNSGYFLAAMVAQRVSGQSLDALLQQRVFKPLRMASTHVRTDHTQVVPRRASAYRLQQDRYVINMANWNQPGDGAVQSTVQDLALWDAELDQPTVLPPNLLRTLQTPGHLSNGQTLGYANGLERDHYRGLTRIQHDGSWAGYRAVYLRFPEQHLGLALTCNSAEADPVGLAEQVADLVLARHLQPMPPAPPSVALSPAAAQGFVGRYLEDQGSEVLMLTLDDKGQLQWNAGDAMLPLQALNAEQVQTSSGRTQMTRSEEGLMLRRAGIERPLVFRRLANYLPDEASLQSLVGRYQSPELHTQWELVRKGTQGLILRSRGLADPVLQALSPDLWQGLNFTLRLERDAQGRLQGFVYDSDQVRGVRFQRM
ncbi:serine hydrolase domain-containing protein [Paucibacter sp. Y2R2-4]|uniref:serine hydrolase domain-containing protein n=1 Tax=Paucibacter sp. Y2R2-4 TaxID=2893553 RepID=UPI0021E49070|nr:serine hydrolase domain-containing protein [Paucibacter sp. Y2R2-4]MCV2349831.1 beta-lactamase family protein [Paucibacter sp. Y2R2-4]